MSDNSKPKYTLGYFFVVEHSTQAEKFVQHLLQVLRTTDPDVAAGHQPQRLEDADNTVAFIESIAGEHIPQLHEHLQHIVVAACREFFGFCHLFPGESKFGITIQMRRDADDKHASLYIEMPDGAKEEMLFAYQVDLADDVTVTPESVTMMPNGKDTVNAVLAYFGELEKGTGQVKH